MISASAELKRLLAENTKTLFKATLTFTDETTIELTGDDVSMGSMTISDAVSSGSSFDVGAAIIGKCTVTLNNYDRRFDTYDFSDAELIPYVGVELSNGTEWLCMGRYYVEQPDAYGSTIGLTALDKMREFEKSYADVQTVYPASLGDIVGRICTHCGVMLENQDFANSSYVINKRPDDSLSCLSVLAYVAQISGNWAKITKSGLLRLDWYDHDAFSSGSDLDGGTFLTDTTPYSDGDDADGGGFMYGGGSYDGGTFSNIKYAILSAHSSLTVNTDDVLITGVRITSADNEDGTTQESVKTALYGVEGYVLEIADNQLIEYGKASTVAAQIGARVVGMRFRPFQSSAIGLPYVEAGDAVVVVDERGNEYESYLTSITYKQGGYESFNCDAESAGRNRANSQSAEVKAFIAAKHAFKREKTAREVALETLAFMLASASGLYKTEDVQSDGSTVYYMHDQPTLAQSTTIWKATSNAFGVSNDGGRTYSYGVSSNGVAILNRIYAVGIDADYIDTGVLTVRDRLDSTKILFKADISTGIVNIGGFNVTDEAIYNDSLKLNGTSLIFRYGGEDIGAIYPRYLVDSSDRMLGQIDLYIPSALYVYSQYPYQGDESKELLLTYSKGGRAVTLSNFGAMQIDGNVQFAGNPMSASVSEARILSNVQIRGSKIFGDGNSRLGSCYIWNTGISYGKTSTYENAKGMLLLDRSLELSYGDADTYGRYPFARYDTEGVNIGHTRTDSSGAEWTAKLTKDELIFWQDGNTSNRNKYIYLTHYDTRGTLTLYDVSDTNGNVRSYLTPYKMVFCDTNNNTKAYVMPSLRAGTTSDWGMRLAAPTFVAVHSDIFGVGNYADSSSSVNYTAGKSGTIQVCTDYNETTEKYTFETITFEKGLMVTAL